MSRRVGVLVGGGDCPGLNAVIRAVARRSFARGWEVVGIREGWRGLVESIAQPLGPREITGILPRGGTIIGTTRTNPYRLEDGVAKVLSHFQGLGLDALVAIGGEDTLGVAARLHAEHEFPVVGVPKTIDNDLSATDYTVGFDTAVFIATEAIDRLHTTAESHNRVMVLEVMGRHTGWIAVMSGIAGGADVILIPERPMPIDEVCAPCSSAGTATARTSRSSLSPRATNSKDSTMKVRSTSSDTCGWACAVSAMRSRGRSRPAPASRRA